MIHIYFNMKPVSQIVTRLLLPKTSSQTSAINVTNLIKFSSLNLVRAWKNKKYSGASF